jgi:hypothetical protein
MTPEMVRILTLHKRWADRYTLLWQLFVLALLAGLEFTLSYMGIELAERTAVLLLLATMVVIAAIWQATGLAIARVHMILRNIDLEQ